MIFIDNAFSKWLFAIWILLLKDLRGNQKNIIHRKIRLNKEHEITKVNVI